MHRDHSPATRRFLRVLREVRFHLQRRHSWNEQLPGLVPLLFPLALKLLKPAGFSTDFGLGDKRPGFKEGSATGWLCNLRQDL